MATAFEAEIRDLHAVLQGWLGGGLARTAANFAGFADCIAADFVIVSPDGTATSAGPVIDGLKAAHGRHGAGFRIRIENCVSRFDSGDYWLGTYEEWQDFPGWTTARISTVLLRRRDGARNGLEWAHLHETWMPGHAPPA